MTISDIITVIRKSVNSMFIPKTEKIRKIATDKQKVIERLEKVFYQRTRVYIDYANVRPWSVKLGWHIDLKRLKQFLDSFDTIEAINETGVFHRFYR